MANTKPIGLAKIHFFKIQLQIKKVDLAEAAAAAAAAAAVGGAEAPKAPRWPRGADAT